MFVTAATTLLAVFAVGVFAAEFEPLTTAQSGVPVPFTTSCILKVVAGTSSNVNNGDVSFLKGTQQLVLFGLHPEWNGGSLAVINGVFKRGKTQWGIQWVAMSYPSGNSQREYIFEFQATELVIKCQGKALISISYNELTTDPEGFLNDIDSVKFKPGDSNLKFSKLCSVSTEARKAIPKLILYDNSDQGGTAITIIGPMPNLIDIGFNDRTGSVWAVTGDWELYRETAYRGDRFFVEDGQKLNARNSNSYSSARPINCRYISDPTTAKLRVSTSSHLQYGTTEYLTPQKDLGAAMRNKITSVVADKGDWEMYEWTGYQGVRLVIKEGVTMDHLGGWSNKASSLRPVCETYKGKEKCALSKIEVLDKEGDLEPIYTGTEIIGSQSSGSCYGPASHEIEITQINGVEESVGLEISKENEVNWDVTVSAEVTVEVGFLGTGSSFSAGVSMGSGGAITMGTSKTTETTTSSEKEHGQVTEFPVPGAGIVFGIVDRYEIDQSDIPVIMHMTCPDGVNKTVDSSIAMKQVSFGAAHFWSLTGEFTKEACRAERNLPDCVENVRKNFANFVGQKAEIEDAFEACFADGRGEFKRMKRVRV